MASSTIAKAGTSKLNHGQKGTNILFKSGDATRKKRDQKENTGRNEKASETYGGSVTSAVNEDG